MATDGLRVALIYLATVTAITALLVPLVGLGWPPVALPVKGLLWAPVVALGVRSGVRWWGPGAAPAVTWKRVCALAILAFSAVGAGHLLVGWQLGAGWATVFALLGIPLAKALQRLSRHAAHDIPTTQA